MTQQLLPPQLSDFFVHQHLQTHLELHPTHLKINNRSGEYSLAFTLHITFQLIKNRQSIIGFCLYVPEPLFFWKEEWKDSKEWENVLFKKVMKKGCEKQYKIQKQIGKGSFAKVYGGTDRETGKMRALKAFSKKEYRKNENKEMMDNEIKILSKLSNDKVVEFQGAFKTKEKVYIVMEYVQGKNLQTVLKEKLTLRKRQRKIILQQLLNALCYLKQAQILHRDIKPANIMILPNFHVKIVDFGLAVDMSNPSVPFIQCGTPGYMDPTLLKQPNINGTQYQFDYRMDMFGVGATLYQMIYGKPLFKGQKGKGKLELNRKCMIKFDDEMLQIEDYLELDLLMRILQPTVQKRITVQEALKHQYFRSNRN